MLEARSGLDWEGRRFRASDEAGVSSKDTISERWNLHKNYIHSSGSCIGLLVTLRITKHFAEYYCVFF